jgi:hypothetical protein
MAEEVTSLLEKKNKISEATKVDHLRQPPPPPNILVQKEKHESSDDVNKEFINYKKSTTVYRDGTAGTEFLHSLLLDVLGMNY